MNTYDMFTVADWQAWAVRTATKAPGVWVAAESRCFGSRAPRMNSVLRYCLGLSDQLTRNPPPIGGGAGYWLWLLLEVEPAAPMALLALPLADLHSMAKLGNVMSAALLPAKSITSTRAERKRVFRRGDFVDI